MDAVREPRPAVHAARPDLLAQVTVIVVTYNSAHCVPELAKSLAGVPNVVFSDNGSGDGTLAEVARLIPQARGVDNGANLGFGVANNRVLREVTTPYAFLLNPDCEIDAARLSRLLEVAESNPDAVMVAPQLLKSGGGLEVNYRWPSTEWRSKGPPAEGLACIGFACGAALVFNMERMRSIGFFDEQFFLYYDDDDLCLRAFDRRLPILLVPDVLVKHQSRGSVRGKSRLRSEFFRGFHHAQSKIRFVAKHNHGRSSPSALRWRVLAGAVALLPLRLLAPQPRQVARLLGRIAGLWRLKVE